MAPIGTILTHTPGVGENASASVPDGITGIGASATKP